MEVVKIGSLTLDPSNARKHSKKNLESIKGSLAKFGQQKPIVISKDSIVIAGNGTLEAAKALGWLDIGVIRSKLVGSEAIAYAIADNRTGELAEWDDDILSKTLAALKDENFDLKAIGFDEDDLAKWLKNAETIEPGCDEDEIPEEVETRSKLGDIWLLGDHRVMCGDSTDITHVEMLMGASMPDFCFTSPPYADQREYNGEKNLSTEFLASFIRASFSRVNLFAVNLGLARKNNEINSYWDDYIKEAKNCGLKFLSWNVWDKKECGSIGNQTAMFGISHEWVLIFGKERKSLNRTVENKSSGYLANHNGNRQRDGSIKKSKDSIVSDYSQLKTVLSLTPQKARDEIDHPARFPVELPEQYILACTNKGESVYEPFCGSGSTLIACEKTGRKCYGMEIDPKYVDVILSRWEKYTGKTATLKVEV